MAVFMSKARKIELCEMAHDIRATLNGELCQVVVTGFDFATVRQTQEELSVEYSWQAVEYILTQKNGQFETLSYKDRHKKNKKQAPNSLTSLDWSVILPLQGWN